MLTLTVVWGAGDIPRLLLRTVAADRRVAGGQPPRYAADDDCPAGGGHPEPAVLARRHWSGSECWVASESALDRFRLVHIPAAGSGEDTCTSARMPAAGDPNLGYRAGSAGLAGG
jgi:hypothetical protein